MNNIDIAIAILSALLVALMGVIINRQLYRRQKFTTSDLWGSETNGSQISDYFYTEEEFLSTLEFH